MSTAPAPYKCPIQISPDGTLAIDQRVIDRQRYPLAMPADCLYGHAGMVAKSLDAPLGPAYLSSLAIYAGMGVKVAPGCNIRPQIYVANVAPSGLGKGYTYARAKAAIHPPSDSIIGAVLASDRGLVAAFEVDVAAGSAPCVLAWQDEFDATLKKSGIKGSTLGNMFNTLYNEDIYEITDKRKGKQTAHVRLSLLGALTCEDPSEFQEAFGSGTLKGFYRRVLITPNPRYWEWHHDWTAPHIAWPTLGAAEMARRDEGTLDPLGDEWQPLSTVVSVPEHVFAAELAWRRKAPEDLSRSNLGELALRIAVISAAANNDTEVTPDCIAAALRLLDWQVVVRAVYLPSVAQCDAAMITGILLDAFRAWDGKHPGKYTTLSALQRKSNWYRKYGASAIKQAVAGLVDGQLLEPEYTVDPKTNAITYAKFPGLRLSSEAR